MKLLLQIVLVLLLINKGFAIGQSERKLQAVKVMEAPKIDGHLNDPAWQNAPVATDFIINQPDFGKPASQKTEVRIVYDNAAIYVAAYLYDDPSLIRRQLTQRDGEQRQNIDYFSISLDTYNDNQNAFQFLVTAANVQSDVRLSPNGNLYNWDAVWESKTSMKNDGWVVEMKIPYMAIRFSKKAIQDWGVNFQRFTRRNNESAFWNSVNPNVNGFVNQMGDLTGLENLDPPLRLSFQPYVSTGFSSVPTNNGTYKTFLRNGGMDVKYGVNESFTLDMTLVPDFGQVVSDNVVLNLSPYEQQFNENRPFFTEGTELFNKAGIFYSRRVGAIPSGYGKARRLASDSGYEMISNPSLTQLYNAAKFSGRNKNNLGIGVFNAVTAPMFARLQDKDGNEISYQTEALANYNIVVFDQAFKNRSSLTFTNANVLRNDNSRNANVTSLDVALYDSKNVYRFVGKAQFSQIWGNEKYNGYKTYMAYEKVSGKVTYSLSNNIESENFDPNDLGILLAPNEFTTTARISYNQNTPTRHFNVYNYSLRIKQQNLYKPFSYQELGVNASAFYLFKNFWDISFEIDGNPTWTNDFFELRTPGRSLKRAPYIFAGIFGSTDSRKKLFASYGIGFAESPIPDDAFYLLRAGVRYRFSPKFSLQLNSDTENDNGNFGWNFFDSNSGEPVIGKRRIWSINNQLNGIYNFTSRMNVTLRARHYWSKVTYLSFHDVKQDGHWTDRPFTQNRDRNFNVFNLDMFYTWDFKPGSRLIMAWKNALGPDAQINGKTYSNYSNNFNQLFNVPHSNEVTLKFVYFLDYLQLKGKTS